MNRTTRAATLHRIAAAALVGWLALASYAQAQELQMTEFPPPGPTKSVDLVAGHSSVLRFPEPIERASINNAEIADVVVISPTQLLINGKQPGSTSLVIWREGENQLMTVKVGADLDTIRQSLVEFLPGQRIDVEGAGSAIVLSGRVLSQAVADQAVAIAKVYNEHVINLMTMEQAPLEQLLHQIVPDERLTAYKSDKSVILTGSAHHPANVTKAVEAIGTTAEKVVNLVDVTDQKQVLIEVRFAEVNRSLTKNFGFDWNVQGPDYTGTSFAGGVLPPQTHSTPQFMRIDPKDLALSTQATHLFELRRGTDINVILRALQEKGLIRILAEPNLLTMTGEEANFLAGGEFPIAVVQSTGGVGAGAVTVEFKEFGIRLRFKPDVASDDSIRMQVEPEVSVLDFGPAAIRLSGFQIPALVTRRAKTTVQLRSGESLVIGGLISQTDNKTNSQVPILGSIPILGQLFSSERFQKQETELLVLVTPRLMRPSTVNLAANYSDMGKVSDGLKAQMAPPPYPEERADAIRQAIRAAAEQAQQAAEPAPMLVQPTAAPATAPMTPTAPPAGPAMEEPPATSAAPFESPATAPGTGADTAGPPAGPAAPSPEEPATSFRFPETVPEESTH